MTRRHPGKRRMSWSLSGNINKTPSPAATVLWFSDRVHTEFKVSRTGPDVERACDFRVAHRFSRNRKWSPVLPPPTAVQGAGS